MNFNEKSILTVFLSSYFSVKAKVIFVKIQHRIIVLFTPFAGILQQIYVRALRSCFFSVRCRFWLFQHQNQGLFYRNCLILGVFKKQQHAKWSAMQSFAGPAKYVKSKERLLRRENRVWRDRHRLPISINNGIYHLKEHHDGSRSLFSFEDKSYKKLSQRLLNKILL